MKDLPLLYDNWITFADELVADGKWDVVARIYRHLASLFGNVPDMVTREANALYQFGDYLGSLACLELLTRPTVSSLLIEARCWNKLDKPEKSVILYEKAETILEREQV